MTAIIQQSMRSVSPMSKLVTKSIVHPGHVITEDTPPDMLEGNMDLEVTLPNGKSVKMTVERRTPMMDLLIQVTTANKIVPGGHIIKVIPDKGQPIIYYKPSTPIGTLDSQRIFIIPKNRINQMNSYNNFKNGERRSSEPFEKTFRLQVYLPRNQLYVLRVSPKMRIFEIHRQVCEAKNLDSLKYELRHPVSLHQRLQLDCTLEDYDLTEVTLVPVNKSLQPSISSQGIIDMRKREEERLKKGILGGVFKKSKSSIGGSTTSSDSYGEPGSSRGTSPIRSDDSLIPSSNIALAMTRPPAPPRNKKRPAPKPPVLCKEDIGRPPDHSNHNGSEISTTSHSRHSSDSSGYHESSILSNSPENPQIHADDKCLTSKKVTTSQKGLSNAANKKRKAPPPPPQSGPRSSVSEVQENCHDDSSSCSTPSVASPSPVPSVVSSPAKPSPIEDNINGEVIENSDDPSRSPSVVETFREETLDKAPETTPSSTLLSSDTYESPSEDLPSMSPQPALKTISALGDTPVSKSSNNVHPRGEEYQECCTTFSSDDSSYHDCDMKHTNQQDSTISETFVEETFNKTVIERFPAKIVLPEEKSISRNGSFESGSSKTLTFSISGTSQIGTSVVSESSAEPSSDTACSSTKTECLFTVNPSPKVNPPSAAGSLSTTETESSPECSPKAAFLSQCKSSPKTEIHSIYKTLDDSVPTSQTDHASLDGSNANTKPQQIINKVLKEAPYTVTEEDLDVGYSSIDWEYKVPDPPTPFKDPSNQVHSIPSSVVEEDLVVITEVTSSPTNRSLKSADSEGASSLNSSTDEAFAPLEETVIEAPALVPKSLPQNSDPIAKATPDNINRSPTVTPETGTMVEREIPIRRLDAMCDTSELNDRTEGQFCPLDNFSISTYTNRTLKETPYDKKLLKSESFSQPKPRSVGLAKAESFNVTGVKPERAISNIETVRVDHCKPGLPYARSSSLTSKPWIVKRNRSIVATGAPTYGPSSAAISKPFVGERQPWKTNSLQDLPNMVQHSDNTLPDVHSEQGAFYKSHSQVDISTDMSGSGASELHTEYVKLEKEFQGWKKQLIQNQCVLQNKLASKPFNLQSLEVIREILPSISRSAHNLNHPDETDVQEASAVYQQEDGPCSDNQCYSTASLDRKENAKRFTYSGPPEVNFGTWSDRPRLSEPQIMKPEVKLVSDNHKVTSSQIVDERKVSRAEIYPRVVSAPEVAPNKWSVITNGQSKEEERRRSQQTGVLSNIPKTNDLVQVKYVSRSTNEIIKTESLRPLADQVKALSRKPSGFIEGADTHVPNRPAFYHFGERVDPIPSIKPTVVSAVKKVANNTVVSKPVVMTTAIKSDYDSVNNGEDTKRGRYTSVVTLSSPTIDPQPTNTRPIETFPVVNEAKERVITTQKVVDLNSITLRKVENPPIKIRTEEVVSPQPVKPSQVKSVNQPPPPPPSGPVRMTAGGKRIVPPKTQPKMDPREELMIAIRSFGGSQSLKRVR